MKGIDHELKLWGDHAIAGTVGAEVIEELVSLVILAIPRGIHAKNITIGTTAGKVKPKAGGA